jgi:uncharacterized membrane protein
MIKAKTLSRELRRGKGGYLKQRRGIVVLSLGAMVSMGVVSLYQMGVLKHVPEPKLPGLDADKVDASDEAYELLDTPDAAIGLGSYAVTLGLAAMGGEHREREKPWIPLLLSAKAIADASQAARLTYDQFARHRAACSWCLLAAGATFATAALAMPEARAAWRRIRKK